MPFICFQKNQMFPKISGFENSFSRPRCLFGNLENWGCAGLDGIFPAIFNQL